MQNNIPIKEIVEIISIDAEKSYDEIQNPSMIKKIPTK